MLSEVGQAHERRIFWHAARDLRAASRDGDAPAIVEECLDEIQGIFLHTEQPAIRLRAGEILASHRPTALVASTG